MNENKTDEIIEVMNYSHKYVPEHLLEEICLVNEQTITIYKSLISPILFGGDQLTASRARAAKKPKVNCIKSKGQLDGLLPVSEDWHTKLNLLTVSKPCCKYSAKCFWFG